jgi:tRNA(fMet)-specific endonuclease VapC
MYFLDTNICIYYLKAKHLSIFEKFQALDSSEIRIPSIVEAELRYGVEKSQQKSKNQIILNNFLTIFSSADFDSKAALTYSKIRSNLESSGTPIGPNDLLIASIVLANNGILVTHNTRKFSRINNLHLEDWVSNEQTNISLKH